MSTKLWAGVFNKDVDAEVLDYTETTKIDARLVHYDIWGSMAHLSMLNEQGIVAHDAASAIARSLLELHYENEQNPLELNPQYEDVHLNIETLITQKIGPEFGGRLHTARSRNDQVVTDTRMYLREEILNIAETLVLFIDDLLQLAEETNGRLAVGYTHLQPAQPINLAFWYSAYASMFLRDVERLRDSFRYTNVNVLGACALAGTSFNINRELTTQLLGFDSTLYHSLDATSSRDFVSHAISSSAIIMSNLSRLAEEVVVWSSHEFGLLTVDDAFATGSSIMPQKKNPVVGELVKGKVGRVYGALMQILTINKGITLGYNCDLQEDKPMLWDTIDTVKSSISISHRQMTTSVYQSERATELCWKNFSTVTELANMLVTNKNIPFRDAHKISGTLVRNLTEIQSDLRDFDYIQKYLAENSITLSLSEIRECVSPDKVVSRQSSSGGTSPKAVSDMITDMRNSLSQHKLWIDESRQKLKLALGTTRSRLQKLLQI
ncbi:argininosuccinate lyase [Xenorhabdus lircayensis]|uniref:Argininosuccinate lyase n=1 Tax=Xenorhabdus lircayensis TaxID=2763499 RepID=A0ABS0U8S5_9GAMM|nr:argininosuccinate lyase [Xenorhabdus lircayensis]MBI6550274.1 argininosuccinate lyase [Xenorhabdus lircayensis]